MKFSTLCLAVLICWVNAVLGQAPMRGSQSEILKPVEAQLTAYNNRDIETFLKAYSDSVKVFSFPKQLQYVGKAPMRKAYADMFANLQDLRCTVVNRIQSGNTIIDHEQVVFRKGEPKVEAIAIYKVTNGEIAEVYFIYPER